MKRLNNKGFMFTETIVVTTILMVSIMSIYVVFSNLYTNYKTRTKYENVSALYAANNIKQMIGQNGINYIAGIFNNDLTVTGSEEFIKDGFIDFSVCPESNYDKFGYSNFTSYYNLNYCSKIIAYSDIKTALVTNYDMTVGYGSKAGIDVTSFNLEFQDYIKYIKKISSGTGGAWYRIIIELNDGSFSNIVVKSTL